MTFEVKTRITLIATYYIEASSQDEAIQKLYKDIRVEGEEVTPDEEHTEDETVIEITNLDEATK